LLVLEPVDLQDRLIAAGYRSLLAVHTSARDQAIGLHFWSKQPNAFGSADFPIARRVADHVALAVGDPEASARWYKDVLGFERKHADVWGSAPAFVSAGGTGLALFKVEGSPKPPPGRDVLTMRHVAFRVDGANFERAQQLLKERGLDVELQDHVVSRSIYFKDPDGHEIEITTYET
jgi:catechol 2,3-dioxygenase-like lactoylglutathione lyase family enzyme